MLFQTAKFVQGKIYHKHSVKQVLINVSIFDINNIFWTPLSVTVSICVIQVSDKSISLQFVCIPFDNGKFRVHSVLSFIHKFLSLSFFIIKILKIQCMMLWSIIELPFLKTTKEEVILTNDEPWPISWEKMYYM